uniref:Uncharacterized protein n=1 Tax=Oncorhynchus mykiss TaxID=8022 RepID=A0A8K9UU07_ONCMY
GNDEWMALSLYCTVSLSVLYCLSLCTILSLSLYCTVSLSVLYCLSLCTVLSLSLYCTVSLSHRHTNTSSVPERHGSCREISATVTVPVTAIPTWQRSPFPEWVR